MAVTGKDTALQMSRLSVWCRSGPGPVCTWVEEFCLKCGPDVNGDRSDQVDSSTTAFSVLVCQYEHDSPGHISESVGNHGSAMWTCVRLLTVPWIPA